MDNKETDVPEEKKFSELSVEEKQQCVAMNQAEVLNEHETDDSSILEYLISIAKRFSGYRYVSLSRFKGFSPDNRPLSATGEMLRLTYAVTQGKNNKEFEEAFSRGDVGLVQAHVDTPPLHEDGFYDQKNVAGKLIKSKVVGFVKILDTENFAPCLVVKQGGGQFGYIEGNPFFEVGKEAFVRAVNVLKQQNNESVN